MDKSLPIIMANTAECTERLIKSYKLIRHGVLIAPLLIGNAYADGDPTYAFNLPAQPLSATLDSLAQSAHTKLIYSDATVKGLRAAPVKGKIPNSRRKRSAVPLTLMTLSRFCMRLRLFCLSRPSVTASKFCCGGHRKDNLHSTYASNFILSLAYW